MHAQHTLLMESVMGKKRNKKKPQFYISIVAGNIYIVYISRL